MDNYIMRGQKAKAEEIFRALAMPDLYAYQRICEMYILVRFKNTKPNIAWQNLIPSFRLVISPTPPKSFKK